MNEYDKTRAKILGILIRDARYHAERTVEECANLLGIAPGEFAAAENGEFSLSLPNLEILAIYLKMPISHFWGAETVSKKKSFDREEFRELRQQVIGGQLRRARVEAGRDPQDLAKIIEEDEAIIAAYEAGEMAIPLLQLEQMGKYLGVSLDFFIEMSRGPLAEHEEQQKMLARFYAMPEEMRQFVCQPINQSYISTAMELSDMDVNRLRRIAEGILDITF